MYEIILTEYFRKQLKKLVRKDLKLKARLKYELLSFSKERAICIGKNLFKIRLKSQSTGKSGGYRIYILLVEIEGIIAPVCIYKKSCMENISENDLIHHLQQVKEELKVHLGDVTATQNYCSP